jgi:hypothetical protein
LTAQVTEKTLVLITNPYFAYGYQMGRLWYFRGEAELPIDDEYLIANIATYSQRNLHNDLEWLAEHVGFIMGMVSGSLIPGEP